MRIPEHCDLHGIDMHLQSFQKVPGGEQEHLAYPGMSLPLRKPVDEPRENRHSSLSLHTLGMGIRGLIRLGVDPRSDRNLYVVLKLAVSQRPTRTMRQHSDSAVDEMSQARLKRLVFF
jgi:hypothetical protein